MPTLKQIILASVLVCALLATAIAQESRSASTQTSSPTITATAAGERVRITAPSSVVQMHVEVYAANGEKLFDQEIRGGNVFDWHLQDGQGQRLAAGSYVCVVTAKSISGKLTQKIGAVSVAEKSVSVQPAESQQLSAPQAQTIGPVEENSSWMIAGKDEPQTGTVIANDGTDGQMIRGRGALTFRIGDFFSGIDREQMRLTEAGNLGIGTPEPKAKLDVAGTIRAQHVLIAKSNRPAGDREAQADDSATDTADSVQPLASGSGTQDRIAKWTDNAGTLGDSGITETAGGFVGIGTTTPGSKLVVSANSSTLPPASGVARFADADGGQTAVFADAFGNNAIFNVRRANGTAASPSALQANQLLGVIGASGYGASAYMGTRARVAFWASEMWTNTANGTYLTFNTTANGAATAGGTERMRIDNAGNVGIGTPAPTAKLDIRVNSALIRFSGVNCGPDFGAITFGNVALGCNNYSLLGEGANTFINRPAGGAITFRENNFTQMQINPGGDVGIGTTTPQTKLQVQGTLTLENGSSPGLFTGTGNTELNRYLALLNSPTSPSASGLKAGGILVADDYSFANPGKNELIVKGNASQSRDRGGFVKAMIYVKANGVIERCYNGLTGVSLNGGTTNTGCGFTVTKINSPFGPLTTIDFGFKVDDRFWSVTAQDNVNVSGQPSNIGINAQASANQLLVLAFYTNEPDNRTNIEFVAIIY